MIAKPKPKQTLVTDISQLILMAKNEGIKDHIEMAKWIIARSVYWKGKGFQEIIKAMKEVAK